VDIITGVHIVTGDHVDIALAHDYLTQRGGAERVVLAMADIFAGAPIYTTLYEPSATFPEFAACDVRPSRLNRSSLLRRSHRLALPFLARDVDQITIDADVVVASSSGWAHGMHTDGRKIVYCHAPARWLYQTNRYASGNGERGGDFASRVRSSSVAAAVGLLGTKLRNWDRLAAASADRYVVNSTTIQRAVRDVYGIEAEVLSPPPALLPAGEEEPFESVEPGYFLVVARLLPYKNVDAVIAAAQLANQRLVVVGVGPDGPRLERLINGDSRIRLAGTVTDAQLRWLYRHCAALVAAAYEDYGLVPLEAAAFGRPSIALKDGGFLDTVVAGETGVFFSSPHAEQIAGAMDEASSRQWDAVGIAQHADSFSHERFAARLRAIVAETAG